MWSIKLTRGEELYFCSDWKKKDSNIWKERGPLVTKMGLNTTPEQKKRTEPKMWKREREKNCKKWGRKSHTCLSLWHDKFMHSSCVCQSRQTMGVCWTISQGGRREERKERKQEGEKELWHWAVKAGNGLIGVDCVLCVDSMRPQSLGLTEGISLASRLLMSHG